MQKLTWKKKYLSKDFSLLRFLKIGLFSLFTLLSYRRTVSLQALYETAALFTFYNISCKLDLTVDACLSQIFFKHLEGTHQQMFCSVKLLSHGSMFMKLFMKDFLLEWIFVCMTCALITSTAKHV